jgi:hypothetical protein
MKRIASVWICSVLVLWGCSQENKEELELIFLNSTIVTYNGKKHDSINTIRYCLKNNTDNVYYINNLIASDTLFKIGIYKNGINLLIFDDKNEEVKYDLIPNKEANIECYVNYAYQSANMLEQRLGYKKPLQYFRRFENNNFFFIYPNQRIYFEYSLNLNKPVDFDGARMGAVDLNKGKEYYAELSMASDSTNYKSVLPREILQSISANNAKVYHGFITSKNKVPIKVIE